MPERPIGTALKAVVDRNANRGFKSRPLCSMSHVSKQYRLDSRHALQLFGWRLIIAAVLVPLAFVMFALGGVAASVGYVTSVVAALLVVFALWTLLRPPAVIQVRADGFRLGRITGAGIRSAQWTDVEGVNTVDGALVIELSGGAQSRVPLGLLPRRATELKRDVHERLNTANGYRRLGTMPDSSEPPST